MNKFNDINDLQVITPELSTDKESLSASEPVIARDSEKLPKKKAHERGLK